MKLEDKKKVIEKLSTQIKDFNHFYLTDISSLNAEDTYKLRESCFKEDVKLVVVKNTLLQRALENLEGKYEELYDILIGSTSVMFTNVGNKPAHVIEKFRKTHDKPILKGAYVEESVYIGEDQIEVLANIKSKEELIGDIIMILQSPINSVISSLKSGGNLLSGVLKTLSEKE